MKITIGVAILLLLLTSCDESKQVEVYADPNGCEYILYNGITPRCNPDGTQYCADPKWREE